MILKGFMSGLLGEIAKLWSCTAPPVQEATERFFYHSFPRRGRGTNREVEVGCKMLALMCNGLVLTPEVVNGNTRTRTARLPEKWRFSRGDFALPNFPQRNCRAMRMNLGILHWNLKLMF